jgi:hypothetical protein
MRSRAMTEWGTRPRNPHSGSVVISWPSKKPVASERTLASVRARLDGVKMAQKDVPKARKMRKSDFAS